MSRPCSICIHPSSNRIDRELVNGHESIRSMSRRYGLSKDSMLRHKAKHLPKVLVEAKEARRLADADGLLAELQRLYERANRWLDIAEAQGDIRGAVTVMRELRGTLELIARLLGEIQERQIHLHAHAAIAPEQLEELSESLRSLKVRLAEARPGPPMERFIHEGAAAVPGGMTRRPPPRSTRD